jgi:hypothetical protein
VSVSTVDTVNTALDYIGQGAITSLDESSPVAEQARRLWPIALEEVLRAHFWKCATTRLTLNAHEQRPAFGFRHAYQLPSDFIRLVGTEPPDAEVTVEGRLLLTDEKRMAISYVRRLEDSTLYDTTLRQCLAIKLAQMMCFGRTASTTMSQSLEQQYRDKLREARAYDAMEGAPPRLPGSSWAAAKLGR